MGPSMKTKMAFSEDEQAELSERNIIKHYFDLGYKYITVLSQLERHHNINMSLRTLKRRLNQGRIQTDATDANASVRFSC